MSFRGIWIVAKDSQDKGHVLFARKYPTVERRHCLIHKKTSNHALLGDSHIVKHVFEKLHIGRKTEEFVEEYDGCQQSKGIQPVLDLDINGEKLWPVIAIQKFNMIFICICLVEKKEFDNNTPLLEIPAISIGYVLIHNMVEFLDLATPDSNGQLTSQIEELGLLLKVLMPFGTPTDTNFSTMKGFLTGKDIGWQPKYRLSAWRPLAGSKAKNQLHFTIEEQVNAVVYNGQEKTIYKDMCEVYGTVSCKADIEGVPEVTLNLDSMPNIHIAFHPCLQWVDVSANGRSGSLPGRSSPDFYRAAEQGSLTRSVCFTPPHEVFPLCHMNGDLRPPVKGSYQMKVQGELKQVQITLHLSEAVKNLFEYFEVHIPFFHSGPINKWDFSNASGTVLVSPDKRKLIWSLGTKFPKTLKTAMTATVLLHHSTTSEPNNFTEDPFCHGLNTYVQIFFKSTDTTLSGVNVDPKSIKLNPNSSPKVFVVRELVSSDYKIWNSFGDALVAFPPTL